MRIVFIIFLFVLSCHAALGKTVIALDHIEVTPLNATNHTVWFCYSGTNDSFALTMPYKKGGFPFDGAILKCKSSGRHFSVPIHPIHTSLVDGKDDVIIIEFRMDPTTLRECSLSVTFIKDFRGLAYDFSLKDFVAKDEPRGGK